MRHRCSECEDPEATADGQADETVEEVHQTKRERHALVVPIIFHIEAHQCGEKASHDRADQENEVHENHLCSERIDDAETAHEDQVDTRHNQETVKHALIHQENSLFRCYQRLVKI